MLVQATPMPQSELQAFEAAIRASGRDPGTFRAQLFEARPHGDTIGGPLRRVHVVCRHAAAQYDASGPDWTLSFARHLERGFFG